MRRSPRLPLFVAIMTSAFLLLTACGSGGGTSSSSEDTSEIPQSEAGISSETPVVTVSSYPLAYIAARVGGDQIELVDISTSGGHAHELELSPAQVQRLSTSDLVLYLSQGFQPAVETAVQQQGVKSLDGFHVLEEDSTIVGDPHVWLDPTNIAAIGEALASTLSELNPAESSFYENNAALLRADMEEVDATYAQALANCEGETLLTSHEAFGYLAQRYNLEQMGVTGIDPEAEPSPARLRELQTIISERGITTLFVEPTTSHHHSGNLSETLGVEEWPLDTMESQVDPSMDVIAVFDENLHSLGHGLTCAVTDHHDDDHSDTHDHEDEEDHS